MTSFILSLALSLFVFFSFSSSLSFVLIHLAFSAYSKTKKKKKKRKKENLPDNIIERSDARASNAHVRDRTPSSILHERRCACCLLLLDEHLPIELDSSSSSSSLPATKLIFSSKTIRLSKSSLSLDYTSSSIINWTNGENVQTFDSWKKTSISTANIRSTNIFTSFNSD